MCQSIFFNKVAGLRYATLLKKRLWDMCFLVNIAKFLRTLFYRIRLGDCFCISNKVLCFHERYVICLYKELRMMEMLLMTSIVITYFLVLIFNFFLRQQWVARRRNTIFLIKLLQLILPFALCLHHFKRDLNRNGCLCKIVLRECHI